MFSKMQSLILGQVTLEKSELWNQYHYFRLKHSTCNTLINIFEKIKIKIDQILW